MQNKALLCIALLLSLLLSACAGTQNRHTDPVKDPWEGFNRKVYSFNEGLDKLVRPVAVAYDAILPDPVQRGMGNFFRNLDAPVTFVNQVLQGKFRQSGTTFGRFLVNSTIGLAGFFDVATKMEMPFYDEDLGQTLAAWGYNDSRYVMVPFFGPSTLRDGVSRLANTYYHPVGIYVRRKSQWWPLVLRGVDLRARFLDQDAELEQAYDPYVLMRDVWLQNRRYKIYDGDPPLEDYDLYLEDEPED